MYEPIFAILEMKRMETISQRLEADRGRKRQKPLVISVFAKPKLQAMKHPALASFLAP
jgi:hypothetical protein